MGLQAWSSSGRRFAFLLAAFLIAAGASLWPLRRAMEMNGWTRHTVNVLHNIEETTRQVVTSARRGAIDPAERATLVESVEVFRNLTKDNPRQLAIAERMRGRLNSGQPLPWEGLRTDILDARAEEEHLLAVRTDEFASSFHRFTLQTGFAWSGVALLLLFVRRQVSLEGRLRQEAETERERRHHEIREIFGRVADAVIALDTEGRCTFVNPQAERVFDRSSEALLDQTLWEHLPKILGTAGETQLREAMLTQESLAFEVQGQTGRWFSVQAHPDRNGVSVFLRETTESKRAAHVMRDHVEILQNAHDGIVRLDLEGKYLEVNPAYARMLGYEPSDLIGRSSATYVHPSDAEHIQEAFFQMMREGRAESMCRCVGRDGRIVWQAVLLLPSHDEFGEISGVCGFVRNVTDTKEYETELENQVLLRSESQLLLELRQEELENANRQLERLATTDGLTGVLNRRTFEERLHDLISSETAFSVVILDVDHFKQYNDECGHQAGDDVLMEVVL